MTSRAVAAGGFLLGFSSGIIAVRLKDVLLPKRKIEDTSIDEGLLRTADEILRFGAPRASPTLSYHRNFVLSYDQERKIPKWVAEHITQKHLEGDAHRSKSKFKPDPKIPDMFSAHNADYMNSGWSRGHMAPAGDNKYDQVAMNESFYLSNVLPQNLSNNEGYWNRLEIYCRDLTKKFQDVYILSGPLMMPQLQSDGEKKFIMYNLIGRNEVSVPTHLYKVIIGANRNESPAVGAFIIPNRAITKDEPLTDFQVPLEEIEKRIGLQVHPKLNRTQMENLCTVEGCKLRKWEEFELYMLDRKLKSANTLHRLEKIWEESKRKNIKMDTQIKDTYWRKREELEVKQKMTKDGVE